MNILKKLLKIIALIIVWPIGIFFLKRSKHRKKFKILIGIISFLVFLFFWICVLVPAPEQNTNNSAVSTAVNPTNNVDNQSNSDSQNNTTTSDDSTNKDNVNEAKVENNNASTSNDSQKIDNNISKGNDSQKIDTNNQKTNSNNNQNNTSSNYSKKEEPKAITHVEPKEVQSTGNYGIISFNSKKKKAILHSGPDSHSGEIEHLSNGERVEILSGSGKYYKVKAQDGSIGYVYDEYVH